MSKQITFKSGQGIEFVVDNITKNITVSNDIITNDIDSESETLAPSIKLAKDISFHHGRFLPTGDYGSAAFWREIRSGIYHYSYTVSAGTNAPSNYAMIALFKPSAYSTGGIVRWWIHETGQVKEATFDHVMETLIWRDILIKGLATKADIGLSNVDNTSDMDKPISTAQIAAINAKIINSLIGNETDKTVSVKYINENMFQYRGYLPAGNANNAQYWKDLEKGYYIYNGIESNLNPAYLVHNALSTFPFIYNIKGGIGPGSEGVVFWTDRALTRVWAAQYTERSMTMEWALIRDATNTPIAGKANSKKLQLVRIGHVLRRLHMML